MRFPKVIRNKKTKVEVTIYGKSNGGELKPDGTRTQPYPFYRICWRVAGQRRMKSFGTYSEAKKAADEMVRDLGSGSQVTALTTGQANDALAALERLQGFNQATGRKVSLLAGISVFCEAALKLKEHTVCEAVDGFLSTVATVKRMDLEKAVEEFINGRAHKTISVNGKRPQLSASYAYIVAMWLREFARTFTGTDVCDLTKELLNAYMASHSDVTARTRNGRRSVLGMFLKWCVRQDYLAAGHRLFDANGMVHETSEPEDIDYYRPAELSRLLKTASKKREHRHLLPVIAMCGLAGLRLAEAVRLHWADVFGKPGYIIITATKSKNRQYRSVDICPALAQWLTRYSKCSGLIWHHGLEKFHEDFGALRKSLKIPPRRNGLRHAFCTYHFALHSNENLTAALAGNSPAMIHAHYKVPTTKAEAEKWFSVCPAKATANAVSSTKQTGA